MDYSTEATLLPDELAAAMAAGRHRAASHSPLAELPLPAHGAATALVEKGVVDRSGRLTESWDRALATLCAPSGVFSLYAANEGHWQAADVFYTDGYPVACTRTESGYRISFPVPGAAVLAVLRSGLDLERAPELDLPSMDFTVPEFAAFAAAVDAAREEVLQAQIDRRAPMLQTFRYEQLSRQLAAIQAQDVRWLCGLADAALPESHRPCEEDLAGGMESLLTRELMQLSDDAIGLDGPLVEMAAALLTHSAYVTVRGGANGTIHTQFLLVRAAYGIWAIESWDREGESQIRVQGFGGRSAEQYVWDYCLSTPAWKPVAPTAVMADQVRPATTPTQPQPSRLPAPVGAQPAACPNPQCGAPLKPGKTFCAACGTRVS
jgi:hypothetical protein